MPNTRGPKGHISCTWVQRVAFVYGDDRAAILCVPMGPNNTNLVEDVEILLPVKFCHILFNSFKGEVENVSANQRQGRPSCFSDRLEKHKLGRGRWDLASCQVLSNSDQRFSEEKSKMYQPIRGLGILASDRPKNTNLVEDVEILLPLKFCWIPLSAVIREVENVSAN